MQLRVCIRKILWGTFNQLPREQIEDSRDFPREQIHHTTPSSFQQIVPIPCCQSLLNSMADQDGRSRSYVSELWPFLVHHLTINPHNNSNNNNNYNNNDNNNTLPTNPHTTYTSPKLKGELMKRLNWTEVLTIRSAAFEVIFAFCLQILRVIPSC